MSKKIFKIITIYQDGYRVKDDKPEKIGPLIGLVTDKLGRRRIQHTGHWALAENMDDAVRVAKKFRIGYPMGTDGAIDWQPCCKMDEEPLCVNGCRGFEYDKVNIGGSVWEERQGELISHKAPICREIGS